MGAAQESGALARRRLALPPGDYYLRCQTSCPTHPRTSRAVQRNSSVKAPKNT